MSWRNSGQLTGALACQPITAAPAFANAAHTIAVMATDQSGYSLARRQELGALRRATTEQRRRENHRKQRRDRADSRVRRRRSSNARTRPRSASPTKTCRALCRDIGILRSHSSDDRPFRSACYSRSIALNRACAEFREISGRCHRPMRPWLDSR
jgi:hypothetical protein